MSKHTHAYIHAIVHGMWPHYSFVSPTGLDYACFAQHTQGADDTYMRICYRHSTYCSQPPPPPPPPPQAVVRQKRHGPLRWDQNPPSRQRSLCSVGDGSAGHVLFRGPGAGRHVVTHPSHLSRDVFYYVHICFCVHRVYVCGQVPVPGLLTETPSARLYPGVTSQS